jgi:hypothetical protein
LAEAAAAAGGVEADDLCSGASGSPLMLPPLPTFTSSCLFWCVGDEANRDTAAAASPLPRALPCCSGGSGACAMQRKESRQRGQEGLTSKRTNQMARHRLQTRRAALQRNTRNRTQRMSAQYSSNDAASTNLAAEIRHLNE